MIAKPYEIEKIDFSIKKLILLHGDNEGAKKETISKILAIIKKKHQTMKKNKF